MYGNIYNISTHIYSYLQLPPQVQEPLLPVPRRDLLLDLRGGGADSAGLLLAAGLADTSDCRGNGYGCLASSGVHSQSSNHVGSATPRPGPGQDPPPGGGVVRGAQVRH